MAISPQAVDKAALAKKGGPQVLGLTTQRITATRPVVCEEPPLFRIGNPVLGIGMEANDDPSSSLGVKDGRSVNYRVLRSSEAGAGTSEAEGQTTHDNHGKGCGSLVLWSNIKGQ